MSSYLQTNANGEYQLVSAGMQAAQIAKYVNNSCRSILELNETPYTQAKVALPFDSF